MYFRYFVINWNLKIFSSWTTGPFSWYIFKCNKNSGHMYSLIWTGFSGERCGPTASCFIYLFFFVCAKFCEWTLSSFKRETIFSFIITHDVCDRSCWMRSGYTFISLPLCRNHHLKYIARTNMQYINVVCYRRGMGGSFYRELSTSPSFDFQSKVLMGRW